MKKILFLCIALVCLQTACSQDTLLQPALKTYSKARVDQGLNPSIAMAYTDGNEVEFFNYGLTQLEGGIEVNEHSVYEIGSISKVFTSILLANEVLKGTMKLSDPIANYLPESVTVPTKNDKQITLLDLATHSSGLPRLPDNMDPADVTNPYADYTVQQLYDFISGHELTRDIGANYEYSNLGMGLLGHILELHTKKTYEALLKETITKPLNMNETGITLTPTMQANLALGHNDQVEVTPNWDLMTLAGAGAIRSTTSDMLKFISANTKDDGSDLYKAMELSHKIAYTDSVQNISVGLAWHFEDNNNIVWHNGGTGGYRAFTGFLKDSGKAVVVLTNSVFSVDGVGLNQLGQTIKLTMPEKRTFPDAITLDADILKDYVGTYQLAPTFSITVMQRENALFAQATGQPEFEIFASAKDAFFLKVVEAKITFTRDEEDKVTSMTLFQNGQVLPGKKVEE